MFFKKSKSSIPFADTLSHRFEITRDIEICRPTTKNSITQHVREM